MALKKTDTYIHELVTKKLLEIFKDPDRAIKIVPGVVIIIILLSLTVWWSLAGTKEETVKILCAAVDMPVGTPIEEKNTALCSYPQPYLPPFSISPVEFDIVEGKKISTALPAGTPMLWPFIIKKEPISLSKRLPKGKKAFFLHEKIVKNISVSAIEAGDRIDIIASFVKGDESTVIPLFQDVLVCSVDRPSSQNSMGITSPKIAVALKEEEALLLAQAVEKGKVRAVLRRFGDSKKSPPPSKAFLRKFLGTLPVTPGNTGPVEIILPDKS